MKYLVVVEKAESNFSAYLPDVPGCAATGKTAEDVLQRIARAVEMHLQGLEEDGLPIPAPTAKAEYVVLEKAS